MCGICGKTSHLGLSVTRDVEKMQTKLRHRGPDGDGVYYDSGIGVGMRRLSIIDVKGGDQPLYNEDRSVKVVTNGEIYNYVELTKELRARGHKFRTKSDCETIAHLYEEMGINFVKKLRGMFAIALWDKKSGMLVLARDRMGEKPIYYSLTAEGLVFASEMKAILTNKDVDRSISYEALDEYFHFYYVPEPKTVFENIKKLPAGFTLTFKLDSNELKLHRYWDPQEIKSTSNKDPVKTLRNEFATSCELTLRSDVAVGISLSGGIDSGSILSFTAPKYKDTLKAFSVGYKGEYDSDERQMAKELSSKFRVPFFEIAIDSDEMIRDFPQLIYDSDDPIADISAYAQSAIWKEARRNNVPVMLGGLGGDELFWGYSWPREATLLTEQKKTILSGEGFLFKITNNFLGTVGRRRIYDSNHPILSSIVTPRDQMVFFDQSIPFKQAESFIARLYHSSFKEKVSSQPSYKFLDSKFPWGNVERETMNKMAQVWLVSNCIALGDRLSMAASVELRSPFLDYKFIETVMSLRSLKGSHKLPPKYWFKKAMEKYVPKEVLERPKRGFTPPVAIWCRDLFRRYGKLLKHGYLVENRILDKKKLDKVIALSGVLPMYWYPMYQILLLEIWCREYIWNQKLGEISK